MPNCPECNTPEAYIGFLVVECLNPNCRHYVMPRGENTHAYVTSTIPPDVQALIDEFLQDEYVREVASIQNAVGNPIPVTMDFRNATASLDGVRLLIKVLRRVRSTLCLRSGQHQESLKQGVRRVAIRHVGVGERKSCTLANGVLDLRVDVNEQASYADPAPQVGYDEMHLDRLIADVLDLELGPAMRGLQEWLLQSIAESNERHRLNLSFEVDWRSFTSNPNNAVNLRVIDQLRSELPRSVLYWMYSHGANDKAFRKQVRTTLRAVRIEHVESAGQREVGVEGNTVFYKMCLTEDGGVFGYELGEVLHATVLSVQAPPAPAELESWVKLSGQDSLQTISALKETLARKPLESYLRTEFAASALKIQKQIQFPTLVDLAWIILSKKLACVPLVIPRVLNRVWGALRSVTQNPEHAELLKAGSLQKISIQFTDDPAQKSSSFANETLALTVCPEQPGTGCFDETELASLLNMHLAVQARLVNLRQVEVPDAMKRLCTAFRSYIELDLDYAGFTSHPDPNKNQFALIQLSEVGVGWVYYALTGQAEDDAIFRAKVIDRIRVVKLVHVPGPKQKFVRAEGSTLVYGMYLHENYEGRHPIDHLKEIFEEVIEDMPPSAPPHPAVVKVLEQCQNEIVPSFLATVKEMFGIDVGIDLGVASIGNNLLAAKNLKFQGIGEVAKALNELASDSDVQQAVARALKKIEIRHVNERSENRCSLKDGVLTVQTCLNEENDALSWSDMYNQLYKELRKDDEEEQDDTEDEDEQYEAGENHVAWFKEFRAMLPQYVDILAQMGGAKLSLDGDWDSFCGPLSSPTAGEARTCLEAGMPLFLTALVQLQMMNPAFGSKLKEKIKTVYFENGGPGVAKEIRVDGERLICRLQPTQGFTGCFQMDELTTRLPVLV